jgi:predicted nucleotidyltransferase
MNARESEMITADQQITNRQLLLKRELERFLRLLAGIPDLDRVVVFGSMAGGPLHAWSDIDLVIVQRTKLPFMQRIHAARRLLRPRVATDIFVYTPQEFANLCKERLFFQEEILRRGKVLYERIH